MEQKNSRASGLLQEWWDGGSNLGLVRFQVGVRVRVRVRVHVGVRVSMAKLKNKHCFPSLTTSRHLDQELRGGGLCCELAVSNVSACYLC